MPPALILTDPSSVLVTQDIQEMGLFAKVYKAKYTYEIQPIFRVADHELVHPDEM